MRNGERIGSVTLLRRSQAWHPIEGHVWSVLCGDHEGAVTDREIKRRGDDLDCNGLAHRPIARFVASLPGGRTLTFLGVVLAELADAGREAITGTFPRRTRRPTAASRAGLRTTSAGRGRASDTGR
jgi:hypothetical protein